MLPQQPCAMLAFAFPSASTVSAVLQYVWGRVEALPGAGWLLGTETGLVVAAVAQLALGIGYLLWGVRAFRTLAALQFGLVGLVAGMLWGSRAGGGVVGLAIGAAGAALLGLLAWRLAQVLTAIWVGFYAAMVALVLSDLMTGPAAPVLGVGVALLALPAAAIWAFGHSGKAAGLYSAFHGALLTVFGLLAAAERTPWRRAVAEAIAGWSWSLPCAVAVLAAVSCLWQRRSGGGRGGAVRSSTGGAKGQSAPAARPAGAQRRAAA